MQRLRLLAAIAALALMAAAAVWLGSPYAPVVRPAPDIEVLWAIEDERQESDGPLVTALQNHGVPLAYDAQENTFYCTLGLDQGEAWPDIHLTAPGAKGVSLCFSDDYTYDGCSEAICDGYAYEVMAYTQTEYAYFTIVFTGLPLISIRTDGEITLEDAAAQVALSGADQADSGDAIVHLRGAVSLVEPKKGYRINFTRGANGDDRTASVPGLGETESVILLPGVADRTMMRDRLSWDLYALLSEEDVTMTARSTQYIELFINDAYAGVYIMMQPYDYKEELGRSAAACMTTDGIYRTATMYYTGERPVLADPSVEGSCFELFYAPQAENPFALIEDYVALGREEDDAAFAGLAARCIDLNSILRYYLFVQAGVMGDNVVNNMYIWAHRTANGVRYRFSPWDMDMTWGRFYSIGATEPCEDLIPFPIVERMLALDVGGVTRQTMLELWQQMRQKALNEETIAALVATYTRELRDSGSFLRETQLWRGGAYEPEGFEIVGFAGMHIAALDAVFEQWAAQWGAQP